MTLEEMYAQPGYYEVQANAYHPNLFFRVEVDDQHRAHQLTPDWQRDGILSKERWNHKDCWIRKVERPAQ